MGWFNRNKKEQGLPISIQPPAASRVEIELHKDATVEAAQKAKEANQHLSDLLLRNGFTLKIYLAAGGRTGKRVNNHGH